MVIEQIQETDTVLRKDPFAEAMGHKPVDCTEIYWSYLGWACRLKDKRATHIAIRCPLAYGGTVCYDTDNDRHNVADR